MPVLPAFLFVRETFRKVSPYKGNGAQNTRFFHMEGKIDYYQVRDRASKSGLDLVHKSPQHYKHFWIDQADLDDDEEEKASLVQGRLMHMMLHEAHKVAEAFAKAPKVDKRTTVGKAAWDNFCNTIGNRVAIPEKMWDETAAMANSIRRHPAAAKILGQAGIEFEEEIYWQHPVTGTPCKSKIDIRVPNYQGAGVRMLTDTKSARDASPEGFAKALAQYRLHVQAAFYLDADKTVSPEVDDSQRVFCWIVVEKKAPYFVAVYQATPEDIELGRQEYMADLATLSECLRTNTWPGYTGNLIKPIELPQWYKKKHSA